MRHVIVLVAALALGSCALAQDLVDIASIDPTIRVEMRYATADNFLKETLYDASVCLLRPAEARRLARVQRRLRKLGLGLKVWDGYRPASVQWKMWKLMPDERYVANPRKGSVHSRGAAVDVTLVDLKTGKELDLGTGHDDFSPKAAPASTEVSERAQKNRRILARAMRAEGFMPFETEWWHFNGPKGSSYPLLDVPLSQAAGAR